MVGPPSTDNMLLLAAALLALALANSPAAPAYFTLRAASLFLVNDVLMTLFFLSVGLEVRREIAEGTLSTRERAALPLVGALGGMVVPAALYLALHGGSDLATGWAVPTATDIAFALGALNLLGPRVPPGLRAFLTALAVADDLGAVLVIAMFYSGGFWSPALAGVLAAALVPRAWTARLERMVKPLSETAVMPLFALANAGVPLAGLAPALPPGPGIAAGLLLGKPVGIVAACALASAAGVAKLPEGVRWRELWGVGLLGGVGFTMSIYIAGLSFADAHVLDAAKGAVLAASAASAVLGTAVLALILPKADYSGSRTPSPAS